MEDYEDVIMSLRGEYCNSELEGLIKKQTKTSSPSTRFLIKHEIVRLNKISKRPFRIEEWFPSSSSKEIKIDGLIHNHNKLTEKEFFRLLSVYGGKYTVGVEEEMKNFVFSEKSNIQKTIENDNRRIKFININKKEIRSEERYFLSREVYVPSNKFSTKDDGSTIYNDGKSYVVAKTINISVHGLKIKLPNKNSLLEGDIVSLVFNLGIKPHTFVEYKVLHAEPGGSGVYRLVISSNSNARALSYMSNLIKKEYFRMKADHSDLYNFVHKDIIEKMLSTKDDSFMVLSNKDKKTNLAYGSEEAKSFFDKIHDGQVGLIDSIFNKECLISNNLNKFGFLVVIKPNVGRAFARYIDHSRLSDLFFRLAIKRMDSLFFKVSTVRTIDVMGDDSGDEEFKSFVEKYAYSTNIKMINKQNLEVLITDHKLSVTRKEANSLLSSKLSSESRDINYIKARNCNTRSSERFNVLSRVSIRADKKEFTGRLINISRGGCSVKTRREETFFLSQKVKITFEALSPTNGILNEEHFFVKGISGTQLHLESATFGKKSFIQSYVNKNIENLKGNQSFDRGTVSGNELILLDSLKNKTSSDFKLLLRNNIDFVGDNFCVKPNLTSFSKNILKDNENLSLFFLSDKVRDFCKNTIKLESSYNAENKSLLLAFFSDNLFVGCSFVNSKSEIESLIREFGSGNASVTAFQVEVQGKCETNISAHNEALSKIKSSSPHKADYLFDMNRKTKGAILFTLIASWDVGAFSVNSLSHKLGEIKKAAP